MSQRNGIWTAAKILIVDDSEPNRRLLQRMLAREGYEKLHIAGDGETALATARETGPDLVLLDLRMPGLSGLEVLQRMQADLPADAYLPVLVITADSDVAAMRDALSAGAMDFLTKPFDATEVLLRVRNLLHTRYLHLHLENRVAERTSELAEANLEILQRLAQAGEFRDESTGQHTQRVGELAARLAERLGLPDRQVNLIRHAAPLHDVGKIGVSDSILLKSGRLTEDEWVSMKRHTTFGAMILAGGRADLIRAAERIALCHHERWDGTGYPRGLKGEEIPIEARVVAVADVYDALGHDRPYRPAWPRTDTLAEIESGAGTHFDPAVVSAFLEIMASPDEPARRPSA